MTKSLNPPNPMIIKTRTWDLFHVQMIASSDQISPLFKITTWSMNKLINCLLFRYLNDSFELKDYLDTMYSRAAQYNSPPIYPVTVVCGGIDGAPAGTDILGRIFAGLVAYSGNRTCYDTNNSPSQTSMGWTWQVSKMYFLYNTGKCGFRI